MSTALALPLMTSEQFFALPEPIRDFTYELHFGELVKVGRPKTRYFNLKRRIRELLIKAPDQNEWLVEPERREIVVVTASSRTAYGPGEQIELPAPLSTAISVNTIFS